MHRLAWLLAAWRRATLGFGLASFLTIAACSDDPAAAAADEGSEPSEADDDGDDDDDDPKPAQRADGSVGGKPQLDGGAGTRDGASTRSDGRADADPAAPGDPGQPGPTPTNDLSVFKDPGLEPWQLVPEAEVADKCKLDPAKLKGVTLGSGFAIVRYGQLCWDTTGGRDTASAMWSATKTLGGLVTGIASYETRDIARSGPKTGQLKDSDLATHWLSSVSYNREAHVAHVLSMVAHNSNLDYGKKTHSYDTVGSVQINTLSTMVSTAIKQDSARLGTSTADFAKKFLFDAIGMKNSTWGGTVYAYSWSATLGDMARLGTLMIHQGVWNGKRILDSAWTYKMTHPAFEDGNTAYGYLTWLVAKEGQRSIGGGSFTGGGGASAGGLLADDCSPSAVWQRFPHGLSEAPDCTYKNSPCAQKYDVGSWSAQGLGGQFVVGHPGLDLVIVAKNYSGGGGPAGLFKGIRAAVIALDPTYKGDEAAFCKAYAAGEYAPDLPAPVVQPADDPAPP
jgi:hypothetical protein